MLSLDVGEGTGISGWNVNAHDSDFVRCPEYLGSFPYRGTLSRKLSRGRALVFLPLTAGPPLLHLLLWDGQGRILESLTKDACCEMPEWVHPQVYKRDVLVVLLQGRL